MGNIDVNIIRKKGFAEESIEAKIEDYCRTMASTRTDAFLKAYSKLPESRDGRYINSDLMKMTFPFYAKSLKNRRLYNMSITNSAAVLTNEAYLRAIQSETIKRCIFITGPYGAGKSYFTQSLFEDDKNGLLENAIVYEGSITPPAFEEKIQYAIDNGVTSYIIALNPTLELSLRNIKERAKQIGRDVEKKEVIDKFSNFYEYMKRIIERFENIALVIYNKSSNVPINLDDGSRDINDLYHGTEQEIISEYDRIIEMLNIQPSNDDEAR